MKYIQPYSQFINESIINESLLQYSDSEGLETVYVYRADDKNLDDDIASIGYDGYIDIYDEDELTKSEIKEIKAKAKEIVVKTKAKEKELSKKWVGWYVITKPFSGDLNSWKRGELVKVYKADNPNYYFIETANINQETYDDVEKAIINNNMIKFNSQEHKTQSKYLTKIDKQGYLKNWEKY